MALLARSTAGRGSPQPGPTAGPPGRDPDAAIMERIRADEREAVLELVERFQNELVGFFYHNCWDQLLAEELAQDVFVNVYRSRHRYQATAKVRTYLYRIAHNLWIDHVRRRRSRHHISIDAEMDGGLRIIDVIAAPAVDERPDADRDAMIRERIRAAVGELPEGQREVFVLANNHHMRYHEIGQVLGIPEGTVKSRMHSAVRLLRDCLQDLLEP
jgi:RNA polymerase sigma-70 factor, ECF subfamily